ncbi:uncharacterized protein LOC142583037 isoform X3 [Dermacentor variabilis]|uniref:uncharacterized protein LOC142583037 isoform X3 n=1 Tax=Dermacentor variabilis TaxID=34621 RepID=UPI003F5B2F20
MASETPLPPAAAPDTDSVVVYSTNALEEREITVPERAPKPKPPPIDVTAAQQYQQPDNKTPTTVQPQTPGSSAYKSKLDKEKKIGHRRVDEEGQITYKKIQTSQIIGSIQLGIGYAVGSLASKPERDLLMQDFAMVESIFFPGEGSNLTPAHHYSDFKFKAYAPVAFRYFRDLFSIKTEDFLMSLCHEPMRELTNPGASGSVFYLTNDDEFIVKTVQHKEAEFLQNLLPGYYMNLNQNPRTLLPKFYGLYCYQCGGKNVRVVLMNNLLPSVVPMHQKYDLKGSTYKRKANKHERSKRSPTFKDLDFLEHHPDGILLEADTYNALIKTIQRDCRVLESFKIMDYSLLVGIHNIDQAARERTEQQSQGAKDEVKLNSAGSEEDSSFKPTGSGLTRSKSVNRQRLANFSTAMESIQADVEPIDHDEDVPTGGIPARNSKGERLLLFIGVIDILQSYRLKKKLEHTWKSMFHDGDSVSVHRPSFYAQRFQDFMAKRVFKKIPSLDLPEIKGPHRKFRALVSSVLALKHSPSKRKGAPGRTRQVSANEQDVIKEETEADTSPSRDQGSDLPASEKNSVFKFSDGDTAAMMKEALSFSSHPAGTERSKSNSEHVSKSVVLRSPATVVTIRASETVSVEGSTPTHTEGTPSFTESSSSGDIACPTTPLKNWMNKGSQPSLGDSQGLHDNETLQQQRSSWRLWAVSAGAWLLLITCCCCCCPEPVGATLCNELTMLSEECQCDEYDGRLTLRWANIHASPLLSDLEKVAEAKIPLYEIQIRDSDLEELKKAFPQFINEHVERLTLDNTRIGQVYVGDIIRHMAKLRSLQLENETIQQLEANMFDSLPLLEELAVNSAHLVSVRENAFVKLNLSRLWLRHNHLTQVPGAVSKLPYLRELDLFENRIEVVTDQEALVLQSNLKHLRRLVMNKMQCDCDLGKGEFLSWIRRANISGVKCGEPPSLLSKDVTALTTKHFCDGSAAPAAGAAILVAMAAALAASHFAVSAS